MYTHKSFILVKTLQVVAGMLKLYQQLGYKYCLSSSGITEGLTLFQLGKNKTDCREDVNFTLLVAWVNKLQVEQI